MEQGAWIPIPVMLCTLFWSNNTAKQNRSNNENEGIMVREKAREMDDGRTTDRPPLLYGQFVSPRTGTSLI